MAKSKMRPNTGMKTVDCREGCGDKMEIASDSISGMCWKCVNKMMASPAGRMEYVPDDVLMDNEEEDDDGAITVPSESWND